MTSVDIQYCTPAFTPDRCTRTTITTGVDNRMGNTSNTGTWAQVSHLPSTTFVGSPGAKEVRASHRWRGGEDGGR